MFWFSAGRTQCLVEVKHLLLTDIQSGFCCECGRGDGMQCFEVFCLKKKKSSSFNCTRVEIKSPSVKLKEDTSLHISLGILGVKAQPIILKKWVRANT